MAADFFGDNSSFSFEQDEVEETGLNITPMVDVIFILLVFFLCVSQFKSGKLKIDLPKVDKTPPQIADKRDKRPIVVELALGGQIAVDKIEYKSFGPIEKVLGDLVKKKGRDQVIVLRADRKVEYQNVSRLLSLIYNAGFYKVEFPIETAGTPK
jgi:biopolymer transport protein ExbD